MKYRLALLSALVAFGGTLHAGPPADPTVLKHVIIFGRHAVRTPVAPPATLASFAVLPFPSIPPAGQALITSAGATDETLLGGYFRQWLTQQNLLTGNDTADAAFVYVRANNSPLIVDTAQAFVNGLLPGAPPTVHAVAPPDPLFDPIDAGVAPLNTALAIDAVNGRLGGDPQNLATAFAPELALARSVLFNYPAGSAPIPTPQGLIDVTAIPITLSPGNSTMPVIPGGLLFFYYAVDPFMMEYTNGLDASDVGWGNLNAGSIGQIFRVYDALIDLEFRTPYLAKVQSSNLASYIAGSILDAASSRPGYGTTGTGSDKIVVLIASNTNVSGLAGLLNLDWLVDTYQRDVSALGGALVFELRQYPATGEYIVRAAYVAQTMDQLRAQTTLTLAAPPANVPVFIPGCSIQNATFDCPLSAFVQVVQQQIDPAMAEYPIESKNGNRDH